MTLPPGPLFDSESDVAALIFGSGEEPDVVLDRFVRGLCWKGYDAVGLVQRRADRGPSPAFYLLPDRARDADRQMRSSGAPRDTRADFAVCAGGLRRNLRRRPDFVALSRFGPWEAAGAGLVDVLSEALRLEIPVAIAVPEDMFATWVAFARGLAVRLPCDRTSLERWWSSLRRSPRSSPAPETFCGRYK